MKIILVRHAKSDYDWTRWPTDSIRPLSEKGKTRQHKVSKGMIRENLIYEEVWVSPYRRAQETLEIIQLYQSESILAKINNNLIPSGNPNEVLRQLKEENSKFPSRSILLVGHNPNMSELLELFSNSSEVPDMRTSDVALCEINENNSRMIKYYTRSELYQ